MASQLTLDLANGQIIRLTALPRGQVDVCVFAGEGLRQRIVFAQVMKGEDITYADQKLFFGNACTPITYNEGEAVAWFTLAAAGTFGKEAR